MQATQASIPSLEVIYRKVEADFQFTLDYLRAVDAAISLVINVRNNAEIAEELCTKILTIITESGGFEKRIDPTSKLEIKSVSAEAVVRKTILALQELEGSKLPKEHAEELYASKQGAIHALQKLHDALVDVRWAVVEHDADLEKPKGKAFDNVEDLFADLNSR